LMARTRGWMSWSSLVISPVSRSWRRARVRSAALAAWRGWSMWVRSGRSAAQVLTSSLLVR
jgi:hypothetical protein